ncbi:MAG: FkbM family methyltransferase [Panacagrimonas sp.]
MGPLVHQAKAYTKGVLYRVSPQLCLALRAEKYRNDGTEEELELIPLLANRDEMAVDVGGNHGFYAFFMKRHCSRLVVVEPNPDLVVELRRGLGPKVSVLQCALSDTAGKVVMRLPLAEGLDLSGLATIEASNQLVAGTDARLIDVEAKTLDSLALQNVGFMKIDVEGHEFSALRGAKATLEASRPSLLIEAEDRHRPQAVRSIVEFLAPMGYQGFYFSQKRLHPIAGFNADQHQKLSCVGVSTGPDKYINNFVFVARPDKLEGLRSLMA